MTINNRDTTKMRRRPTARSPVLARGATLAEAIVSVSIIAAIVSALMPMLGSGAERGGIHVSANNLRRIAEGCAAYEASWNGRQWTKLTDEMAERTGCAAYTATLCPPTMVLGNDGGGGFWAYWIRGTPASCNAWPGSCGNWPLMMPISVGGTTGTASSHLGSYQLVNARGVREYIVDRFWHPVFYAPNDALPYQQLQRTYFNTTAEFTYSGNIFWGSTYTLSPAALWGVGVFRAPSQGGFQAPDNFPEAYHTPTSTAATYPSLKTRLMEDRWCQGAPGPTNPMFATPTPYFSNADPRCCPGAVFFDGHVAFVKRADFAADDAMAIEQSGDGLWSRDTPLGQDGYWGAAAIGDFRNSSHIFTTGGITGRDLLHAR